jgi:hypothetical protein
MFRGVFDGVDGLMFTVSKRDEAKGFAPSAFKLFTRLFLRNLLTYEGYQQA